MVDIDGDIQKQFGSHYKTRKDPKLHCWQASMRRGYVVFALQDGGQCFGSSHISNYKKYGKSSKCSGGKGGPMANDVYEINHSKYHFQQYHL